MIFNNKKYSKFNMLGVSLILIITILFLFGFDLSVFFAGYLSKVLILVFTACIAIVEFNDIFKKEEQKKKALYFLVTVLFLTSLWDTGKESIDFESEARKRDSLITVDSLRFVKIVNDLSTSIGQLEEISGSVVKSLEEVVNVKKSVGEQKPLLNNILNTTTKSSEQTQLLTSDNQPNLVIYGKRLRAYFSDTSLDIEVFPANIGNGQAYNIKIFYQVLHLSETGTLTLLHDRDTGKIYPKDWTKFTSNLPAHVADYNNRINLKTSLTKEFLEDNGGFWILIYSMSYLDFTKSNNNVTKTVTGKLNESGYVDIKYDNVNLTALKPLISRLDFDFNDFIFTD